MYTSLANNLRELLQMQGISESELARRTAVPQPVVNNIKSGKANNPTLETLKKLADYFLISMSQLIGEEPLPSSSKNGVHSASYRGWHQVPCLDWEQVSDFIKQYEQTVGSTVPAAAGHEKLELSKLELEQGVYTQSISSCDAAAAQPSSAAYNIVCEQRVEPVTKSQLERRRVYNIFAKGKVVSTNYISVDIPKQPGMFALTMQSLAMKPQFPPQTKLIFVPGNVGLDGGFALIKLHKRPIPVFKQLFADGGEFFINSINPAFDDFKQLTSSDKILASLVQARFDFMLL